MDLKLKAEILPIVEIEVGEKTYQLVLDMNALAKAGAELNKDLTDIAQWQGFTGPDLTVIAWAALDRYHPDITLREVRQWFGAVDKNTLFVLLIEGSWPGITERIEKVLKEQKKEDALGKSEPNLPVNLQ